jgi:predicted GIY-YIG superfamily endonuclease
MFVYAIGKEDDLYEPYDKCYIGVTNNLNLRWGQHEKSRYKVGQFIRNNSLSQTLNMKVVFEGDDSDCFLMEESIRPDWNIGLNIAPGGQGGRVCKTYDSGYKILDEEYSSRYTPDRNSKISNALKNMPKSETHKEAISNSRSNSKATSGKNNGRAKKWLLTSPSNVVYNIHGNLTEECSNMNLLTSALKTYVGHTVPLPNYSGFGGYRPKSEKSKMLRENTTGWMLSEVIG